MDSTELQPTQEPRQGPASIVSPATTPQPPDETETASLASREPPPFIFALGHVAPRFPSLSIEKEFAQVVGRADTEGLTDRQVLRSTLADRGNRYLVRKICWSFVIEGLETYILMPRDPVDSELLIDALRDDPDPGDVDVVIGERGPLAPPDACNGLSLPIVAFDQIYSFDRDSLISAIPRPEGGPESAMRNWEAAAGEMFDRIMQLADNAGALDEHRALNYLAVRYPAIYATTADAFGRNASLASVDVRRSRLSGPRNIVDVIFSYTGRETDVTEKYFVRVDVTEEFPFLVTKLSPFFDR